MTVSSPVQQQLDLEDSKDLIEDATPIVPIDTCWEGELISHMDLSNLDVRVRALAYSRTDPVLKDPSPTALWSYIFRNLKSRRDLLHVALSCKFFYLSSIKLLYERLAFADPEHFVKCSALLSRGQMLHTPKHLTVSFSPFPHLLVPLEVTTLEGGIITLQYTLHCDVIFGIQRSSSPPSFASESLYSTFVSTFTQFSHLESLTFTYVYVPPTSLTILSIFPNLRSLVLRCCYYPDSGDDPVPELNELRTLALRDLIFHDKPDFGGLLLSPKLSEVSIDDTSSDVIVIGKQVFKSLRRLRVFRAENPYVERINPDDIREVTTWVIFTSPLIEYVFTEFGTASPSNSRDQLPLIKSLKCYVGPCSTSPLLEMGCRSLTTLVLSSDNNDIARVKFIVTAFQNLSSLSLTASEDLINNLAVISPLPSLKELNLLYTGFTPSNTLGQQLGIIVRGLRDLSTVTSLGYLPADVSTSIPDPGISDLSPLFWSSLLEVRLHREYVWWRAGVSCVVWERKVAAIYDETHFLCLRIDPAQNEESCP